MTQNWQVQPSDTTESEEKVSQDDAVDMSAGVASASGVGAAALQGGPVDEGSSLLADHDDDDAVSEAMGPVANGNTAASHASSAGPPQGAIGSHVLMSIWESLPALIV